MSKYHRVNIYLTEDEHSNGRRLQKLRSCKSFSAYVLQLITADDEAEKSKAILLGQKIAEVDRLKQFGHAINYAVNEGWPHNDAESRELRMALSKNEERMNQLELTIEEMLKQIAPPAQSEEPSKKSTTEKKRSKFSTVDVTKTHGPDSPLVQSALSHSKQSKTKSA